MTKFKTGKTYSTRSICDNECVYLYTVIKRTAKFITIRDKWGEEKRVGVRIRDGVESAKPEGTYSMCPVIKADRAA